jgi:probable HAF family extracellular repeat protein
MGSSEAYGVNGSGAVVGRAEPPDGEQGSTRAFLYRDGAMVDLNNLIPATSGYFVADARAINDRGAIAAEAFTPAGAIHAVLLVPSATATGHVFYNNSAFDGHNPAANAVDDAAVAPDKAALTGPAAPTFANVTSYGRGINGILIDVDGATGTLTRADFDFRVGNGGTPANWPAAPEPSSVTVRPGAGVNGSDRVTVTWADGAIRNAWLRVSVLPSARTGLWSPGVFSFGNLVGETGGPATAAPAFVVDGQDVLTTRARISSATATITEVADFDRDGRVSARDLAIVRWDYGASLSAAPQQPPAAALSTILTGRLRPTRRSVLAELL